MSGTCLLWGHLLAVGLIALDAVWENLAGAHMPLKSLTGIWLSSQG
jgi:hypothetical protein